MLWSSMLTRKTSGCRLGIKQLEPDKWEEFFSQHQIGDVAHGKIVRLTSFGVFVELSEGIEGLCHVSELADSHIDNPEDHFEVGQELDVKIIKLTLLERRIGLSVKALTDDAEGEEGWAYKPEVATASIGDIAGDELGQLKTKVEEATEDGNDES